MRNWYWLRYFKFLISFNSFIESQKSSIHAWQSRWLALPPPPCIRWHHVPALHSTCIPPHGATPVPLSAFFSMSSHCLSPHMCISNIKYFFSNQSCNNIKAVLASCLGIVQHAAISLWLKLALIRKQRIAPVWSWDCSILIRANTWATNYENKKRIPKNGEITYKTRMCN